MDAPKLSVCIITYNNEKYIAECLQSILDQQVSFPFEIIVGDDVSTDNTVAVIREYQAKYPGIITCIVQPKNTGGTENYQAVHRLAKGEYVAHCDGDDYFLPGKLQKQADYLDKHKKCVQLWHRQQIVNTEGELVGRFPYRYKRFILGGRLKMKDLAVSYGMIGQHSSQMYRRSARTEYDRDVPTLDFFYALDIASKGYSRYMNVILGSYRVDQGKSITTSGKGKMIVENAVTETAMHYSEKYGLGKQFYGNLWARRLLLLNNNEELPPAYNEVFEYLSKYKTLRYRIKAVNVTLFLHSSMNLIRLFKRYLKINSGKKKNS